ncbi:hypothetical protein [Microbacterium sp.]|uniref:hypothetical protein n=1 Tax=Microbacterium sp. TaxID=51671 RepID=UPI0039E497D1
MAKNVWIGVRGAEQWFKAPAPRAAFQPVGWSATTQGRNGRVTGRASRVTHMEYDLSWPTISASEGRKVNDWFYGVAGSGLIHWLDPMLENVLPAHWSMPGLGCTDGPVLYGLTRPTAVSTATNTKNLPATSAVYTLGAGVAPQCYIPIPPDYTAHIGVHGGTTSTGNSIVVARPMNGETAIGSSTVLPWISTSSTTRFTTTFPRTGAMTGLSIRIAPGETFGTVTTPNSGTIAGIMVEVLPDGQSPSGTGFIRGGGNSGCRMFEPATEVALHAVEGRERMSVAAKLIEVGP